MTPWKFYQRGVCDTAQACAYRMAASIVEAPARLPCPSPISGDHPGAVFVDVDIACDTAQQANWPRLDVLDHQIAAITGHNSLSMVQEYPKGTSQKRLAKRVQTKRDRNRTQTRKSSGETAGSENTGRGQRVVGSAISMAGRQGFEPWGRSHAQRFSRPPHSTTLPPPRRQQGLRPSSTRGKSKSGNLAEACAAVFP